MAYVPPIALPRDPAKLNTYLLREFRKIATASNRIAVFELLLTPLASTPSKPQKGLIVYADGSNWDPGSGEGVYRYDGTTWHYLG